jgi:hypothetical protein
VIFLELQSSRFYSNYLPVSISFTGTEDADIRRKLRKRQILRPALYLPPHIFGSKNMLNHDSIIRASPAVGLYNTREYV